MEPMQIFSRGAAMLLLSASASFAQTTLQLDVQDTIGQSIVYVLPGASVDFEIVGELGGDASEGLAMFAFDLSFSGGALTPVVPPAAGPVQEFVAPRGVNNPEGYGGTLRGGVLKQVGGAMNTIANSFAPAPSGIVVTGAGNTGPEQLATGSLTAPMALGSYEVEVSNVFANALVELTPAGFWSVKAAEGVSPSSMTVVVVDCMAVPYCVAKQNSAGCFANITPTGMASLSGQSVLSLQLDDVINDQFGLFIWAGAEAQTPLFGGTLCVGQPYGRELQPTRSGGTGTHGTNCSGSFTRVIDATFLSQNGFALGETLFCQFLYRDRFSADGTTVGMSNGVRFTVCP